MFTGLIVELACIDLAHIAAWRGVNRGAPSKCWRTWSPLTNVLPIQTIFTLLLIIRSSVPQPLWAPVFAFFYISLVPSFLFLFLVPSHVQHLPTIMDLTTVCWKCHVFLTFLSEKLDFKLKHGNFLVQFVISIAQSDLILPYWSSILNNHVCICRVCMIPLSFIFLPISTWEQLWLIMYKSCARKWCWASACGCWLAGVQAKIGRGIVMTRPNQFVVGQNNIFSGGNPAKLPSASPSPRNPFQAVTEN